MLIQQKYRLLKVLYWVNIRVIGSTILKLDTNDHTTGKPDFVLHIKSDILHLVKRASCRIILKILLSHSLCVDQVAF